MNKCKWLPDIIEFPDLSKWKTYEDELYKLFVNTFIINYPCLEECINCNKIKYWEELYKNKIRINLFFEDFRYFVVLEDRSSYYLLITAYYIHYDEVLEKKRKKYIQYCKQKKPLI